MIAHPALGPPAPTRSRATALIGFWVADGPMRATGGRELSQALK